MSTAAIPEVWVDCDMRCHSGRYATLEKVQAEPLQMCHIDEALSNVGVSLVM